MPQLHAGVVNSGKVEDRCGMCDGRNRQVCVRVYLRVCDCVCVGWVWACAGV